MNYHKIEKTSIANGTGVRVVLWCSGCSLHCEECHNPETWDFNHGQEFTTDTFETISHALEPYWISGLSILSGVGIGWAAAQLYVPIIQIAYANSDQMVPLQVVMSAQDNAQLLIIVGIVMAVCLCILGGIVSRMKIAKALKLGED
jgi:pyruvate-formate lyase-activating enzyme